MTDAQIFNADDLESTGNRFKTLAVMEREGEYKAARVAPTPGPWVIGQPEQYPHTVQRANDEGFLVTIATTNNSPSLDDAVCAANARLIAASPQLLWALNQIVAILDQPVQYAETNGAASILRVDCRIARNAARAAIAAATGAA